MRTTASSFGYPVCNRLVFGVCGVIAGSNHAGARRKPQPAEPTANDFLCTRKIARRIEHNPPENSKIPIGLADDRCGSEAVMLMVTKMGPELIGKPTYKSSSGACFKMVAEVKVDKY